MKIWFYIFSLFISASLAAQSTMEEGYIVTIDNDTLSGFIQKGTDADLSTEIFFKPSINGTLKKYKPQELLGFGFSNGRTFERKKIETTSKQGVDSTFIFTKNLIRGKIDLFVLRFPNRTKPDIFLTNNITGATVHLSKPLKKEFIGEDGKKYDTRDNEYLEKLAVIKGDPGEVDFEDPIKYSEKKIKNEIARYNENFEEEYPVSYYEEEVDYNYTLLAGIPIGSSTGDRFRVALYRNRSSVEKSSNFSFMQGIIYHHWSNEDLEVPAEEILDYNIKWQYINVIPLGIRFHGNSKKIQPYGYAGLGFGAVFLKDHIVEDGEYTGEETDIKFLPSLNAGIGAKIRVGKFYMVTELTPTYNGFFFNLGFSI